MQGEMAGTGVRIGVIGSGAWGTTLAALAGSAGHDVRLLFRSPDEARRVAEDRRHERAVPGLKLPESVHPVTRTVDAIAGAALVILAVPSQVMREAARQVAPHVDGAVVLSVSKGIEIASLQRMSQVIGEEFGGFGGRATSTPIAVLSGPNLSGEIAAGRPTVTLIASADTPAAGRTRDILMGPLFRCYTSADVVGVELAGALKNVYAIGAGIGAGMEAGENAKAAFITRGIAEMTRLGLAAGADAATFAGIAGLGDLIATCSSSGSRNQTLGRHLAAGLSLDDALARMHHVAEGVTTTVAARQLGRRLGVDLPIVDQMHAILFEGKKPTAAVADLMGREPRAESTGR
jgi:glycerol-3-phosphate dehydrogenase (NAD(P)+)